MVRMQSARYSFSARKVSITTRLPCTGNSADNARSNSHVSSRTSFGRGAFSYFKHIRVLRAKTNRLRSRGIKPTIYSATGNSVLKDQFSQIDSNAHFVIWVKKYKMCKPWSCKLPGAAVAQGQRVHLNHFCVHF